MMKKLEQVLDKSLFGKGVAKSWQSLVDEIQSGECQILWSGDRPIRQISVLKIQILADEASDFPGASLYEAYQEFLDGRRRSRDLFGLSEKIKPGEDLDTAAVRALQEELGINSSQVAVQLDPEQKVEEKESPSYPGLVTRYVFHAALVVLKADVVLPRYEEIQPDKKTVFVWRNIKS